MEESMAKSDTTLEPTGKSWNAELKPGKRRTLWACFGGWALDAIDVQIYSFAIPAIVATFAITNADAGLIGTVTLLTSASLRTASAGARTSCSMSSARRSRS
jgi:hypothetical protein